MIFVATVAAILAYLPEWTMNANAHTSDWSDDDVAEFVQVARDVGAAPLDLAGCWMSESNLRTAARNPGDVTKPALAVGLFQLTHAALGPVDLDAIRRETVSRQLKRARVYYSPHKGRLVSPGACYLATYLPALMAHAGDPTFVLCSATMHDTWYTPNKLAFDPEGKGYITVSDLTRRIRRVTNGPRWEEFAARVSALVKGADTLPELPAITEDNRDQGALGDGDGTTAETFPGGNDEGPAAA